MRTAFVFPALLAAALLLSSGPAAAQDAAPTTPTPGVLLAGSGIRVLSDGTVTSVDTAQRARVQTAADGTLAWTIPSAFAQGVVPIAEVTGEDTAGSTDVVSCKLDGPPTNTTVKVRCSRGVRTPVISLGGLITLNFAASPGPLWVHLAARAP